MSSFRANQVSTETDNSKWFLVYSKPREEKKAKINLENQGFEIFLPMIAYEKSQISNLISLEAMFPRYLFIKFNTETSNWHQIKSTRGVSHLVLFGQKLTPVPHQVVKFLKKRVDHDGILRQKIYNQSFKKGDTLLIKQGTFKDMEATFLSKKSNERVKVLLRLVNQLITADIPASDVGEKEVIEELKI